jgi:hypothetical protein
MKNILIHTLALILTIALFESCSVARRIVMSADSGTIELQLGDLNTQGLPGVTIAGHPTTVSSPFGSAVHFDGKQDGLFLEKSPLLNLRQFTVEVVFKPDPKGQFEQRFIHMGEVNRDRMMLELRLTPENQWYLDAHIRSGDTAKTLIDPKLLHPAGEWTHIALVVDDGKMDTYVGGKHELEGRVPFSPFKTGGASIGVRMNKVSWFLGTIARIRVTPRCLAPSEFIPVR